MPRDELDSLLAEQIAYYRARAGEYDRTSPFPFDPESRAQLVAALDAFAPRGAVLELACGTGQWTVELARHATRLTAVDASPEMLALNRRRVAADNVRYLQADLFTWTPPERYDVVFFSAWLTHVPPQRFDAFWSLVDACLGEQGRVFVIDELPGEAAHERVIAGTPAPAVERELQSGARYRTVKAFYAPPTLRARLAALGWRAEIRTIGWRFFYATARRASPSRGRSFMAE
ncbi:MAG TPA: class I SAM-dependent methyltransferase [Solirubrobacteraceae bacterium]|nr:class I SAM-dependent methyltransferase [Solirubrobacteraceae bacterium]